MTFQPCRPATIKLLPYWGAIGLGNVWRFPYITGKYGGAAFVLIYLLFLLILGLPVMVMEFSVGRASQRGIAQSFQTLEPKGSKWHWYSWFGIAGNYLLMMFYTSVAGWLVLYCIKMAKGDFAGLDTDGVASQFSQLMGQPGLMTLFMVIVVLGCMLVCSRGLRNGVEKVNKVMMICLLAVMVLLAVRSVTLDGAGGPVDLALEPRLTVRENMASLFHKASRGKRGLSMLEGRFAAVQADLARAEQAGLMAQAATSAPTPANAPSPAAPQFRAPELPKNVQPFRSSDGFLLLRGRDAKGNAQLLKLAAPHDLWMHTGGGPGAHILIRRDHAAQEIPSRTISEAAILSVLKSWRKDETQVDVIAALAKFVHPIRGAKPGTVRIDRMEPAIIVTPDPSLEEKLAL